MTSASPRRLLSLAAFAFVSAAASLAAAEPEEHPSADSSSGTHGMVKALLRHGFDELEQGNLEAARSAFAKAYEIDPQPTVALSLAEVEMKLGLYQQAAQHWLVFLERAPTDSSELPSAREQLAECRRHLGRAQITVSSTPAELFVDERAVGQAPLAQDLWLSPGQHTFSVRSARGRAMDQKVTIVVGELSTIDFRLEQDAGPSAARPAPRSAPSHRTDEPLSDSGSSARTTVLIAGGALTAVALGAGVYFTLSANAAAADISELRDETRLFGDPTFVASGSQCTPSAPMRPVACDDLTDRIDDHDQAKSLAIASFVVSGVVGAATIATYLLWPAQKRETARLKLAPWPLMQGRGVQAEFTF